MSPMIYFITILSVYSRWVCSVFQWIAEQFIKLFSYISWLIWNVLSQIIPPKRGGQYGGDSPSAALKGLPSAGLPCNDAQPTLLLLCGLYSKHCWCPNFTTSICTHFKHLKKKRKNLTGSVLGCVSEGYTLMCFGLVCQ